MQRLLLSLLAVVLFFSSSFAGQGDSTKSKRVKLFISGGYKKTEEVYINSSYPYLRVTEEEDYNVGNYSIVMEYLRKKKISHEVGIMPIKLNSNKELINYYFDDPAQSGGMSGMKTITYSASARYKFNYYILGHNRKWSPRVGVATGFDFVNAWHRPVIATSFPSRDARFDIPLEVVPGINIKLKNKLSLDIDIPIIVNNLVIENSKTDNPSYPEELRKSTNIYGVLFPIDYKISIGLCYTLNK